MRQDQETGNAILYGISATMEITPDGEPDVHISFDDEAVQEHFVTTLGMIEVLRDTIIRKARGEIE